MSYSDALPQPNYLSATRGIKSWLLTLDHKRIGVMYFAGIMAFFFMAGLFALVIRLELISPSKILLDPDTYNQFFTLHGVGMVFLFIVPSTPAILGNLVMPLMLGAKDVAFPRLNLMSWYLYVIGAAFAMFSMVGNAVDTGWTFYTPYSSTTSTGVISMGIAVFIVGFSSILTGLNFIVTVHKLRAPGLTWFKLPLFVWALYATAVIQVLATPVIGITMVLLLFERLWGIGIFDPAMGGDPVLFPTLFLVLLPPGCLYYDSAGHGYCPVS